MMEEATGMVFAVALGADCAWRREAVETDLSEQLPGRLPSI